MDESHREGPSDQYQALGLTVLSKHNVDGLQGIVKGLRDSSRKVKVIQLVTAVALLGFVVTDMLPTLAVVISGAAVLVAATVVGKRAAAASVADAGKVLGETDFAGGGEIINSVSSDPVFLKDLVESGVASIGQDSVVNVDGDFIVVCSKASENTAS